MSNYRTRTTEELQTELTRINASADRGGPVFGAGYWNHGYARREIEGELSRRGVAPAVTQMTGNSQAGWPDPDAIFAARAAACRQSRHDDDGMQMQNPNHQALDDLAEQTYAERRGA